MTINKILLVFFIYGVSLFSALLPKCMSAVALAKKPNYEDINVIMVAIDTLRYDHLGCYGYHRNTSPNIDRLAKSSIVFDNFIVEAYLTPICQASIFTSLYPNAHGLDDFSVDINYSLPKGLPEIFKHYDYFNAAFLSAPEFFDTIRVDSSGVASDSKSIFSHYFDIYQTAEKRRHIPEKALDWIQENKKKKFFLWIPIGTVHWPYGWNIPEASRTIFDSKGYSPFYLGHDAFPVDRYNKDRIGYNILSHVYKNDYYLNFAPVKHLTEKDKEFIISRYDAGIKYTDFFIGKLLSVLENNGLMEKTAIIIYSIHGEDLGEHGYFTHYDIYDTEVKNALIIKLPGGRYKDKRIKAQVRGIDIAPTLLDYLGIPVHHSFQGQSLMPLIRNDKHSEEGNIAYITRIPIWGCPVGKIRINDFKERRKRERTEIENKRYEKLFKRVMNTYSGLEKPYDIALRTNKWKLIVRGNKEILDEVSWWGFISGKKIYHKEIEFYDLEADPFEQQNVAHLYPEVVAILKEKLLQWDSDTKRQRPKKAPATSERLIIPYP